MYEVPLTHPVTPSQLALASANLTRGLNLDARGLGSPLSLRPG